MKINNLFDIINDEVETCGSIDMSNSLGIQEMPNGYALMLNSDHSHFYWIRDDGLESCIHWDKWAVYKGAKLDKKERIRSL